ncbi:MAG: hydrogenase 4 subunit B, partial [Proteobacteria bacterium]
MAIGAVLTCVAALLVLAGLGVVLHNRPSATRIIYSASLGLSSIIFLVAVVRLLTWPSPDPEATLPLGLPWIGARFRIDAVSAFFLAVVNFGAAAASLYALGYGEHEEHPERVLPFYPAFLAGMNIVVLADDAFSFLVAWEFMSLASWALVVAHHQEAENTRAGYIYLLMASFGTLTLLLTFGLLAGPAGGYGFTDIRAAQHASWLPGLVLALALIGTGSKAGLVPLHVWLPLAHPAAPSHVSALMSGVMTKVAVYGFVRIVFDLLGEPSWWWSIAVLGLGSITAVLGVL